MSKYLSIEVSRYQGKISDRVTRGKSWRGARGRVGEGEKDPGHGDMGMED